MKNFWKYTFAPLAAYYSVPCIAILAIILSNVHINYKAKDKLYDKLTEIPKNRVGLVLGTSKFVDNNTINLYYKYRLEAAFSLDISGVTCSPN